MRDEAESITNLNNILIKILNLYKEIIEIKIESMTNVLNNISPSNTDVPAILRIVKAEAIAFQSRISQVDALMVEFEREFGKGFFKDKETLH